MSNPFSRIVSLAATLVLLGCLAAPAQILKGRGEAYSPQWGGFQIEMLNKELKLTPQQQAQIKPIVGEEQRQFAQIHARSGEEISAALNPDQQKRFGAVYSPGGRQAHRGVPAYSPQWGGFMLRQLTQELKLNKEQQVRVGPMLTQAQGEFQEAHRNAESRIAAVLNADQQKKFREMSR